RRIEILKLLGTIPGAKIPHQNDAASEILDTRVGVVQHLLGRGGRVRGIGADNLHQAVERRLGFCLLKIFSVDLDGIDGGRESFFVDACQGGRQGDEQRSVRIIGGGGLRGGLRREVRRAHGAYRSRGGAGEHFAARETGHEFLLLALSGRAALATQRSSSGALRLFQDEGEIRRGRRHVLGRRIPVTRHAARRRQRDAAL